ncbi:MAG: galactokinase family protein [Oscillospiraceae bacterium]
MNNTQISAHLTAGEYDARLITLYGTPSLEDTRQRCLDALQQFVVRFGEREGIMILSAPGRIEVGGNHTDHNGGRVIAAAINLDILAVAAPSDDGMARLWSQDFGSDVVDLSILTPQSDETGTSRALLRGVASALRERGYPIGGWVAYTISQVPKGSGLSSSAAFEILLCNLFSHLYGQGRLGAVEAALISQRAENVFFGKPCGLEDQIASSVGGFVSIDFFDPAHPRVAPLQFDLAFSGHALCFVDTKGSHHNLTDDYAAIPIEMKAVAEVLGADMLAHVSGGIEMLMARAVEVRQRCGDRAFLRALHFYDDSHRAALQADALQCGNFSEFLRLVTESGRSSWMLLQNIYAPSSPSEQGLAVALALTKRFLAGQGACRVQGGGFAGTMQAYVPLERLASYRTMIEGVFGVDSCHVLHIRAHGGTRVL